MNSYSSKKTPLPQPTPSLYRLSSMICTALKESENLDISVNKLAHSLSKIINADSARDAHILMQLFDLKGRNLTGVYVEDTGNLKQFIVIYDDQGTPRLPLTEINNDDSYSKLHKRIKKIQDAALTEIAWLEVRKDLSTALQEDWNGIIFRETSAIRKKHSFEKCLVVLSYEDARDSDYMSRMIDKSGMHLSIIVPVAPYLPISIRYRLEGHAPSSSATRINDGRAEQPFHDYHCFAHADEETHIPLRLLDTAFKYHFDEIIKFCNGITLRPIQTYYPSYFGVKTEGIKVITTIDDERFIPSDIRLRAKSDLYYKEYQKGDTLPDGKFSAEYRRKLQYELSNSSSALENTDFFQPSEIAGFFQGNEIEVSLHREKKFTFIESLRDLRAFVHNLGGNS